MIDILTDWVPAKPWLFLLGIELGLLASGPGSSLKEWYSNGRLEGVDSVWVIQRTRKWLGYLGARVESGGVGHYLTLDPRLMGFSRQVAWRINVIGSVSGAGAKLVRE